MSLQTIQQAATDPELTGRIVASAWRETIGGAFGDTAFGQQVLTGGAPIVMVLAYPVAVDVEVAYEAGGAAAVTDAMIGSAVQAHWPADPAS